MAALRRASWADRALLVEALAWLAAARAAVLLLPFRLLARRLDHHIAASSQDPDGGDTELARRVGWAMGAVASRTPWRSLCLEQAIAAKAMLRRRGMPNTLHLGVARGAESPEPSVVAHAWLRCGSINVTGGRGVSRYTVVATFADLPEPPA